MPKHRGVSFFDNSMPTREEFATLGLHFPIFSQQFAKMRGVRHSRPELSIVSKTYAKTRGARHFKPQLSMLSKNMPKARGVRFFRPKLSIVSKSLWFEAWACVRDLQKLLYVRIFIILYLSCVIKNIFSLELGQKIVSQNF